MFDIFVSYLFSLFDLIRDLWLWFLVGFIVAGIVDEFVPVRTLLKHFGENDWRSLARASLAGLLVSVCSCGAIPIAATLRKKGASTATSLTFLLATPWAGFSHLFILYGFMGFGPTATIFTSAIIVAFLTGLILARFERKRWIEQRLLGELLLDEELKIESHKKAPFIRRILYSLSSSYSAFLDIGKYLGIGLLVAAALKAFVPSDIIPRYLGQESSFDPILLALPLSVVIELCSEGFSVFTGQLFTMGATLGVVFIMLMVGVTTDFTEVTVIWGKFGKRCVFAYLSVSTVVAFLIAHIIDPFSWIR